MPKRGTNGEKGDLWVKFEVEMPGVSWAGRLDSEVSPKATEWSEADFVVKGDEGGVTTTITGDGPAPGNSGCAISHSDPVATKDQTQTCTSNNTHKPTASLITILYTSCISLSRRFGFPDGLQPLVLSSAFLARNGADFALPACITFSLSFSHQGLAILHRLVLIPHWLFLAVFHTTSTFTAVLPLPTTSLPRSQDILAGDFYASFQA